VAIIVRSIGDVALPDVTAVTDVTEFGISKVFNDLEPVTGFTDPVTKALAAVTIFKFLDSFVFFASVTCVTGVTPPSL
jgi:hypothetical protein